MRAARKTGQLDSVLARIAQDRELQQRALSMGIHHQFPVGSMETLTPQRTESNFIDAL